MKPYSNRAMTARFSKSSPVYEILYARAEIRNTNRYSSSGYPIYELKCYISNDKEPVPMSTWPFYSEIIELSFKVQCAPSNGDVELPLGYNSTSNTMTFEVGGGSYEGFNGMPKVISINPRGSSSNFINGYKKWKIEVLTNR